MAKRKATLQLRCPFTSASIEKAFGEEVHFLMHCHLSGYDKHGNGEQRYSELYDRLGAPAKDGYHAVEELLAEQFNLCDNDILDFPLVAGIAGCVHLYKPQNDHEPWNWTGWVPRQKIWFDEGRFFSNRYFLTMRGSELQNNLWDYRPRDKNENDEEVDDMKYSQFKPTDPYRGGYFFERNPFGRYLHLVSLRSHSADPATAQPKRYNYICHPLAYRKSMNNLPDNSVDAMQWVITNIAKEEHFYPGSPWGDRCHALEIFSDFTFSHSFTSENEENLMNTCYNGTVMPTGYRYWFNTYPLEFAEYTLDSALARGVYLQTLTSNETFYKKPLTFEPTENSNDDEENLRRSLSDSEKDIDLRDLNSSRQTYYKPAKTRIEEELRRKHTGKEKFDEVVDFLSKRAYGFETVLGYTSLIDTKRRLRNMIFDQEVPGTGLDEAESVAMDYLIQGNFYSSTGVYNIFNYSQKDQFIPYVIENQPDECKMCDFIDEKMSLVFTFEKVESNHVHLIWRYTIMIESRGEIVIKTSEKNYGYFMLSDKTKTVLDLSAAYDKKSVKWLYFCAIHPLNPMRRAWFNAVRGPAFGEPRLEEYDLPMLHNTAVFSTTTEDGDVVQNKIFAPLEVDSGNLDFMFSPCARNKVDICVYFMQACPRQQDTTIKGKTDMSSTKRPPRINQCVHGYFLLHPDHSTRLNLGNSWDKTTVKGGKVSFYEINVEKGTPQNLNPVPKPYV